MNFDIEEINELVKEEHEGNKKYFAEELGVARPTVSRILNDSMTPTKSFITNFYKYCREHKLNFDFFILN